MAEKVVEQEEQVVDRDYRLARLDGPGNSPAFASGSHPPAAEWDSTATGLPVHVQQALAEMENAERLGNEVAAEAARKRLEAAGLTKSEAAAARKAYAKKLAADPQESDTGKPVAAAEPAKGEPDRTQAPAGRKSASEAKAKT